MYRGTSREGQDFRFGQEVRVRNSSPIHYGAVPLRVIGGPPSVLAGECWTSRETRGELRLESRIPELSHEFEGAQQRYLSPRTHRPRFVSPDGGGPTAAVSQNGKGRAVRPVMVGTGAGRTVLELDLVLPYEWVCPDLNRPGKGRRIFGPSHVGTERPTALGVPRLVRCSVRC